MMMRHGASRLSVTCLQRAGRVKYQRHQLEPPVWWVLPCTAALSGTDQPSARVHAGTHPWTPWAQTGLRLVVACCGLQAAGKEGGPSLPLLDKPP